MAKSRRRNSPFPASQSLNRHQVPLDVRQRFIQLHNQGKHSETLTQAEKLTQRYPKDAFAWKAMGIALSENQLLEQSVEPLKKAHALAPKDAEICNSLGRTYFYLGQTEEALLYTKKALELEPGFHHAHKRLTEILVDSGRYKEALTHIDQALETEPNSVELKNRKATALKKSGRFSESLTLYEEIHKEHPEEPEILSNLAVSYTSIGRFTEAEAAYRQAHELQSNNPTYLSNLLTAMHYNPAHDAETIRNAHLEWEQHFRPANVQRRHAADPDPNRRLRVGMISAGFRTHPVGLMISSALQHLPIAEFELFAYSMNNKVDDVTRLLAKRFDHWLSVMKLSDKALADQIRADDIDILIDLCGHGEGNRNLTMALEPAPLQVKWVGLQINTSGLSAMDYMISDAVETPPGVDALYVEKLIRLPDDYICYLPPSNIPKIEMLPSVKAGHITFGCFNNPSKVNPVVIEQWSRILNGVANSRLFLKGNQYDTPEFVDRIAQEFETHGISRDRLIFEGLSSHPELMACYNRVDIALDPWPYSGGLTTCEALMMGVPVITYPGPTFAGRHSATHLVNAGLQELVVDDWDQYVSLAISLANDPGNLATIRLGLRLQLTNSPVCDDRRFAGHLRTALRAIWQRYCEGKAPAPLTFDKQGGYWFEEESQSNGLQGSASRENEEGGFEWNLESKVIAIDNGGQLLNNQAAQGMLAREKLEVIVLDPLGQHINNPAANQQGVHYYPNASLGDGEEATLYACEDMAQSATLKPLQQEWLSEEERSGREVVERYPIATVPLDKIEGLPSVDWLILDEKHDLNKILGSGKTALKDALVLQVGVTFQASHHNQASLDELNHWASRNGFRFYRFFGERFSSQLPVTAPQRVRHASELVCASAILVPSHPRMKALSHDQRLKLAFLLHKIFSIKDLTYALLCSISPEKGNNYLLNEHVDTPTSEQHRERESEKDTFVHICFNNMHTESLLSFLHKEALNTTYDQRAFVERHRSVANYDVKLPAGSKSTFFNKDKDLDHILAACLEDNVQGVFIHGLFFDWQKTLIQRIASRKKVVWVMWGGDLYNPINNDTKLSSALIEELHGVSTWWDGDYELFTNNYGSKPRVPFLYPWPRDLKAAEHRSGQKENNIIVGNSGDPSNNHEEILRELAKKKDIGQYNILVPVSYNAPEGYVEILEELSTQIGLKDNVVFLREKLPEKDYYEMLATSKIVVMAQHRQQGGANVIASLYYGNGTIVRKDIVVKGEKLVNPLWSRFTSEDSPSLIDFDAFKKVRRLKDLELTEYHKKAQKKLVDSLSGDNLVEKTIQEGFLHLLSRR